MFGQRFDHLFPSPGLKIQKSNEQPKSEQQPKRQNYHMNSQTLSRPPLDPKKVEKGPDEHRKIVSSNRDRYMTSLGSLERIRRSLTPTFRSRGRQNSVIGERVALKKQGEEDESKREQIVVDLYFKIFLFKTQFDETPMTFIKGKVDIFTQHDTDGFIIIHKLNNYSDHSYDSLSCRIIATKNLVKKNQVQLFPADYEVVMAGFIEKVIEPRSSNKGLQIKGPWIGPKKTHPHLTLILCDEREKKILFTTNCFSFQQVILRALKKDEIDQKVY